MMEKLLIPGNVVFDETHIKHAGDVVIGNDSVIGFGIDAKRVIAGDRVTIEGDVFADEIRFDSWVRVKGDVFCRGDAFIGEFSSIEGKLTVHGNLEIGRNVRIGKGFEAKGLITIQDPLPILIFIFVYLMELLRLGKLDEIEELLNEEFENPLVIPSNSKVSIEQIKTDKNALFENSRILGNVRAKNVISRGVELYGSLRGKDIFIEDSRVHGAVEGERIYIVSNSTVFGNVVGDEVYMEKGCAVEGSIVGRKGVWIKEKVEAEVLLEEEDGVGEEQVQEDVSQPLQGS